MAAKLTWHDKDPQANKDYSLDWKALLATGETITDSAWTVDDAALVIGDDLILGSVCTVWISGGTAGGSYKVKNTITTSRGLIDERTISIKVKEQ
jgi:hypothetical protein